MSEFCSGLLVILTIPMLIACFLIVLSSSNYNDDNLIRVIFLTGTSVLGCMMITYCLGFAAEYQFNRVKSSFKDFIHQEAIAVSQYQSTK